MGTTVSFGMAKQLKCGSKPCWIGVSVFLLLLGLILIIVSAALGGCSCTECKVHTGSCTEYVGGCKDPDYTCGSLGEAKYGGDSQSEGAFLAELGVGITALIMGFAFSCGICPACCFATDEVKGTSGGEANPATMGTQKAVPADG